MRAAWMMLTGEEEDAELAATSSCELSVRAEAFRTSPLAGNSNSTTCKRGMTVLESCRSMIKLDCEIASISQLGFEIFLSD
jgi:hypothetical protein